MQKDHLDITLNNNLRLIIYPHSDNALLFEETDAADYGESRWQLQEGREYEYEFVDSVGNPANVYFVEIPRVIKPRKGHINEGSIITGIYVGTLLLQWVDGLTGNQYDFRLEVQSIKTDYRRDYRKMLSDITEYYTDLVMSQGAPVVQKFEVDYDTPQETLYQKFSFVKSIVESESFEEAIHQIVSNPVRSWTETTIERHIENTRRLTRSGLRQIASSTDRVSLNGKKIAGLSSFPRTITVPYKKDTVDINENQFVKYVLTLFYSFCSDIGNKKHATEQLKIQVNSTCNLLLRYLGNSFFKDVSLPSHLNLNSPVLQRKEGYREVLQAWLIFDLAAKLNWKGGDDVFEAGKRNVAALYEYWLFFKLLEIISFLFDIPVTEKEKLVSKTNDGLNLEIKQGKWLVINGTSEIGGRKLKICFYYNKTFRHRNDMYEAGSWTLPMRPDYTLSIWPGSISDEEAENEDLIVHIHFDAKYRVNKVKLDYKEVDEDDLDLEKELNEEKAEAEMGIYKNIDLLKMHAYKDAIRRTSGAYVLYPGDKSTYKKGFHEIIPGLGAFCISPGNEVDQVPELKRFLIEVRDHMLNRISQREKMAMYGHITYEDKYPKILRSDILPDNYGKNREFMPDRMSVLIGYCSSLNRDFILKHGWYNVRSKTSRKGSMKLNNLTDVDYLLLWNKTDKFFSFHKIKKTEFDIVPQKEYYKKGYKPSELAKLMKKGLTEKDAISKMKFDESYIIVSFETQEDSNFKNMNWNLKALEVTKEPKIVKLSELLEAKVD